MADESGSDKKCEYPRCKNAGAPCRPECIGDLATYICPYDGFTDTQRRAAEVLRHFAPSAERSNDPYNAVADSLCTVAEAARQAFIDFAGFDPGEWDGDSIEDDVIRGLVGAIQQLASKSSELPSEGIARMTTREIDASLRAPVSHERSNDAQHAARYCWLTWHAQNYERIVGKITTRWYIDFDGRRPNLDAAIDEAMNTPIAASATRRSDG